MADATEVDDLRDVPVVLVVALAENRCIGRNGKLPWQLPGDLKHFREITWGKPVVMGRKTWESLKGPLPGRTNIVVTRQKNYLAEGARVVTDVPTAMRLAQDIALVEGADAVAVIGGGDIFAQTMDTAQRLYFTEVHAEVAGDAFFPSIDMCAWRETSRTYMAADGHNPYPFSFVTYVRRSQGASAPS